MIYLFAAEVNLQWEMPILAVAVLTAVMYLGKRIRNLVHALDQWDQMPRLFEDMRLTREQVTEIRTDILVLKQNSTSINHRVTAVEEEIREIRDEMVTKTQLAEHTLQDHKNFDALGERFDALDEGLAARNQREDPC